MNYDYDLFVIGAGSGGVRAARLAAQFGAKVGVAEEFRPGGTCVIRGCVPKKFMVYASEYPQHFNDSKGFGYTFSEDPQYDHASFIDRLEAEVTRLSGIYRQNLTKAGAELFDDRAEFEDQHTLRLTRTNKTVTSEKILIAVGGTPYKPSPDELPGVDLVITSDEIFSIKELPKTIAIGGGGYIAVEFAHIFAGLGVETHLVYRGDLILRGFDQDVRESVREGLLLAGVNIITNTVYNEVTSTPNANHRLQLSLTNGEQIACDQVMLAAGRWPHTKELGCEKAGIKLSPRGAVQVDDWSKTNVENIWAVGDVTDRVALTPVAIREGHAFADTEFGGNPWHFDHKDIATAVFTQPPVGTVGLSEQEAREKFGDVDIYKTSFRPMKNILAENASRVFMKVIAHPETDKVLGCHIVGPDSPEIIQAVGIAIKMGATKTDFDNTCALHPSLAEELVTMRSKWEPQ